MATAWVLLSDLMLAGLTDPAIITTLSIAKGLAFILVSSVLLALALRAMPAAEPQSVARPSRPWLLWSAMAVALVSIGAIALLAFQIQSEAERQEQWSKLQAVAQLETESLSRWLDDNRRIAEAIGASPTLLAAVNHEHAAIPLAEVLNTFRNRFDLLRMEIRTPSGALLATSGSGLPEADDIPALISEVTATGQTFFFDLHHHGQEGAIHFGFVAPLRIDGDNAAPLGVVVLVMSPEKFLYPYLRNWPLPGATGETVLARRDGDDILFLNPLRHQPDAALSLRLPLSSSDLPAAIAARAGGEVTMQGLDYRHIPVLATARPIPGTPWILVAKIDEAEALAGIRRLAALTALLTIGALALAGLVIGFLWQRQSLATARRDAAQNHALETNEAKFRSYVESCPVALFVTDDDGRYVDCNPAAVTLLGYDAATLTGMRIPMVVFAEDQEMAVRDFAALKQAGRLDGEYRLRRQDGDAVWVRLRGVTLPDGHVMAFCQDITEQRLATAALRDSEARFASVFRASPIGISLSTLAGTLVDVNQAWLDLLGYERDEVIGRSTLDLNIYFHPEDRQAVIDQVRSCGKVTNLEFPCRRKTGERVEMQYSAEIVELSNEPFLLVMVTDITQRKAEAVSLRLYGQIVEHLGDPIVFVDCEERYVTVNQAYATLLGMEAADMLGRTVAEVIGSQAYQAAAPHYKEALAGRHQHYPLERLFPDGHRHAFDVVLAPFAVGDKLHGVVANMHDVTELRQTQDILEAAQALAGMGSWSLDFATDTYTHSTMRSELQDVLGHRFTGQDYLTFIHPEDRERRQLAWQNAKAGAPFDMEYRLVIDDKIVWIHVKAEINFDAEGKPLSATGMTLNVTATREAQTALESYKNSLEDLVAARTMELKSAEAKMRLILESSGDGLFGIDTQGRITFINRAACAQLGYGAEQMLGMNCHQSFHANRLDGTPYPEQDCPISATLLSGTGTRCDDDVFWQADGKPLPVSYSTHPMVEDGVLIGAVISFADISKRKRTEDAREAALAEAERLATVRREFLANMSHEIRTPLTAVLGLAQLGQTENNGRKSSQLFTGILDASQTLLGVVDDILDFSKIEAGKLSLERQPLVLGDIIDRAIALVAMLAYSKGLDMRVEEDADLPESCFGDALRLAQVLGNLLSNAVKFTTPPGTIVLSAKRDGDWLVFLVRDSGIGMNPSQMARLFQPFEQADGSTTRHFGGTGLGLAITKTLVGMMGGTITVDSRLGVGTSFTVRIPLSQTEAPRRLRSPNRRPESIVLAGLSPAETAPVLTSLMRQGITVATLPAGTAVPLSVDLAVTTAELAGTALGRAVVDGALAQNLRVALVTTPGAAHVPTDLTDRVLTISRPLRARHLLAIPAATAPLTPVIRPRLDNCRILLAEDNEVSRMVLGELLIQKGAHPDCVENGRIALEHVATYGCDAYDIVITDIQMPEMDGYELAQRISALSPALPIIGLTAHAMAEERDRCLAAGMVDHVAKPVTIDHLVPIILRHIRRPLDGVTLSLFDRRRLETRYGDRTAFIAKLMATVCKAHHGTPGELRMAISTFDYPRMANLAHTIKGTAGNLESIALHDLAQHTETAARATQTEALKLADELAVAMDKVLADLAQDTR